jgi:hypothetical protein
MRFCVLFALALLLAGCSPQSLAARDAAVDAGAEANDRALAAAEFAMCRGASIGSVMRRYATSADRAAAWRTLCLANGEAAEDLLQPVE